MNLMMKLILHIVSKPCKTFANNSSVNIKLSKTQISKIAQSGGSFYRFLGPLIKNNLSLMKNVLKPLSRRILIPLELTAAASVTDDAIQKTIHCSGETLIISNEEMDDILKTIKPFQESGLLIKGIS